MKKSKGNQIEIILKSLDKISNSLDKVEITKNIIRGIKIES